MKQHRATKRKARRKREPNETNTTITIVESLSGDDGGGFVAASGGGERFEAILNFKKVWEDGFFLCFLCLRGLV
ncbi:hypothetical protein LguiB_017693 [Lonicera macranthoides]